jgi:ATP-binding cassette subfamily C protein
LDEPNSNLDSVGEMALGLAMVKAKAKGTTIVAITQRHALLQHVDRIMVMEKGAISAIGESAKVMAALAGRSAVPVTAPRPAAAV